LRFRVAGLDTFHRTYRYTSIIAQAQTCNYMSHNFSFMVDYTDKSPVNHKSYAAMEH